MKKTLGYIVFGTALVFGFVSEALCEYPPDNAAVLYYKAFLTMEKSTDKILANVNGTDINEPNHALKAFLKDRRPTIKLLKDAVKIEKCEWGDDYREGFDMLMPYLLPSKTAVQLLILQSRAQAANGDYMGAMETLNDNYTIARHLSEGTFVNLLLAGAIEAMTSTQIGNQLGVMPLNAESLEQIKSRLAQAAQKMPTSDNVLEHESLMINGTWVGKTFSAYLIEEEKDPKTPKHVIESIRYGDDKFWAANQKYFLGIWKEFNSAFHKPYEQGVTELQKIVQRPQKEIGTNPDACFAYLCLPRVDQIFNIDFKNRNAFNALRAAVEVYLVKARTGNLPTELPAGTPVDLYSGKPFVYEIKLGKFVLRSQGKDLLNNIVPEYEFKVK